MRTLETPLKCLSEEGVLTVFLEGDIDFWVDGAVFRLKPGDILLINPGELH